MFLSDTLMVTFRQSLGRQDAFEAKWRKNRCKVTVFSSNSNGKTKKFVTFVWKLLFVFGSLHKFCLWIFRKSTERCSRWNIHTGAAYHDYFHYKATQFRIWATYGEYDKFRLIQDREYLSDFDKEVINRKKLGLFDGNDK